MFDADRWQRLLSGAECTVCSPAFDDQIRSALVTTLPSGRVILQNDGEFPGYCILYHARHVAEIHQLTAAEQTQFIHDIAKIAAAIEPVCKPAKLNYAMLGNEVPHLHCHVIPRYPADGWWGKPIWSRPPEEKTLLSAAMFAQMRAALEKEIKSSRRSAASAE